MEIKNLDIQKLFNDKYYVYRLVDPRTFQTFYVGKGCGDRVFQHVNNVKALISTDEDAESLKEVQIAEIISSGRNVISIIHRSGLTSKEAFEVEAALIDAYPGLTNIQKGRDFERGSISLEDLCNSLNAEEYDEPEEKYIIVKTSLNAVISNGNLYEATRKSWKASLKNAKKYGYVFSVINGIVQEVYKVEHWFQTENTDRIEFIGAPANDSMAQYKGKLIPEKYRKKGASNPFLYKK